MKLTIAHLYYDLLNLYGEGGNIKILKKQLEKQKIEVDVKLLSLGDHLNFDEYDFIYIGSGTESNQLLALKHLINYDKEIKNYISSGKHILSTGNSFEMFGKYILKDNEKIDALKIFDFYAQSIDNRLIDESIFQSNQFDGLIIGFQNQSSIIKNNEQPWFKVVKGIGSAPGMNIEGINYNNFYGTYLVGPIFVRNPHILKHITKTLVLNKDGNFKFTKFDLDLEYKAYNNFIKTFYNDL